LDSSAPPPAQSTAASAAQPAIEAQPLLADVTATEVLNGIKLRLAEQYAPWRWRRWLGLIASAVERGESLEIAIGKHRSAAPREASAIADSALLVGDPAQLILDVMRVRVELRRTWVDLWMMLIYPTLTLVFAVMVGVVFSNLMDFQFLDDFGLSGAKRVLATIEDQRRAMYGLAFVVGWTSLILGTIAVAGPSWSLTAVLGGVRLFGRPLRWINLSEILYRYGLFIAQGLPTTDAAAAVTRSFGSSAQRYVAAGIEQRIAQGVSLGSAFAATSLSDSLSRPALRMLDHRGADVATSLDETSQLLKYLVDQRCRSLTGVLPLIVLLLVGTIVWSTLSCYVEALIPLGGMITSLA
jgi:type II secretory pathway component PulF